MLLAFATLLILAQSTAPATPSPAAAPPCAAPEYRQFDFWIGEWDVRTPDGALAGTNSIRSELNGCVLHERWEGAHGMKGESVNTWSAARRGWHQTWVDDRGTLLLLDGARDGARMVLTGEGRTRDGKPVRHRLSWEPVGEAVRQLWESSTDQGRTWTVVFDGKYTRRPR